jgi:hypothetical protein
MFCLKPHRLVYCYSKKKRQSSKQCHFERHYMSSSSYERAAGTIIKPGPVGRPGGWTGPGLIKDRLWQQPGQTRATRNPGDPGEPGRDPVFFFFFKIWVL